MGTKKSTRAHRKASRKSSADVLPPPAVRLGFILQGYQQHATALPSNPLVSGKTPQEALKACSEFTKWLFRVHFEREGAEYIYLMLTTALDNIGRQLEPLFDAARQAAEEAEEAAP